MTSAESAGDEGSHRKQEPHQKMIEGRWVWVVEDDAGIVAIADTCEALEAQQRASSPPPSEGTGGPTFDSDAE